MEGQAIFTVGVVGVVVGPSGVWVARGKAGGEGLKGG